MSDLVTLNVGGSLYTTTVATLTRYPDSMLGSMFSPIQARRGGRVHTAKQDNNGHYIIDRDGPIFRHVLNFLRGPKLCLPHDFKEWDLLSAEAEFFQIKKLVDEVKSIKDERSRREMEFIEITFSRFGGGDRYYWHEMTLRGDVATLQKITTLTDYIMRAIEIGNVKDSVDEARFTCSKDKPDRMTTYKMITRLGFKLLNTTTSVSKTERKCSCENQITLFGR